MARIRFFRILEINQRLAVIWDTSIQEQLNPIHSESQQFTITVKNISLTTTRGGKKGLGCLQSFIPPKLSLFDLSHGFLGGPQHARLSYLIRLRAC